MTRTTLILAALAALVLALAPLASAGTPYRFTNRAVFERFAAANFVALELRTHHARFRVRSIGCAKGGIGRASCAVYADGPQGTQRYAVSVNCPSDSGVNCTLQAVLWP